MSDHAWVVVRLDPVPPDADRIATGLREWLVAEGVLAEDLSPGPRWEHVVAQPDAGFHRIAYNGVAIITDREVHTAAGNYEPSTCGRCGEMYDYALDWVDEWWEGVEPTLACEHCGWSALAGDWPGEFGIAVGAPAIRFENWPPFDPAFLDEVRRRLGGRTRVILEHL